MTSDTTAPRANRQGDPCPQWCAADHDRPFSDSHVGQVARGVYKRADPATPLFPAESRVLVFAPHGSPDPLAVQNEVQAAELAGFLRGLAGMSRAELLDMAAAVTAAAAVFGGAQ